MFKVEAAVLDLDTNVTYRDMGYGRNDLADKGKSFIWTESLGLFLAMCANEANGFIKQCEIDDKILSEPDIEYLYRLGYPLIDVLSKSYPPFFCELILHFSDIVYKSFFNQRLESGFAINRLDEMVLENEKVTLIGIGYFFGSL